MTCDGHILSVDYTEACAHRLIVSDALGVTALHESDDGVGKSHGKFLHHLIVAYDIYYGRGGYESDAVERGPHERTRRRP